MKIFAKPDAGDEVVILLHGLSRTPRSLRVMQEALMQAGYGVMNHGYASTRAPMADLVAGIGRRVAACGARRVHSGPGLACRKSPAADGADGDAGPPEWRL
jgi:hypothetical protein